jgi:Holliday junction resolvase
VGDRYERKFVNYIHDQGGAAVRLGGSGSGTNRALPDLIVGFSGDFYWVVEEKYRGGGKQAYISAEKAVDVTEFGARFGARAMGAVRYSTDLEGVTEADWRLCPLAEIPAMDSGKLKLHHSIAQDWPLLTNVVENR